MAQSVRRIGVQVPVWYLPTMHGDVRLESLGRDRTRLRAFDLSPAEEEGMRMLRRHALAVGEARTPWADLDAFLPVDHPSFRSAEGFTIDLGAPIAEVQGVLSRALKPGRTLVTAVLFSDGRMEEVHEEGPPLGVEEGPVALPEGARDAPEPPADAADRRGEVVGAIEGARSAASGGAEGAPRGKRGGRRGAGAKRSGGAAGSVDVPESSAIVAAAHDPSRSGAGGASVAATVAAPRIGCPTPVWPEADVRANRVLEAFLTPDQLGEYRRYGAFMAVGADTGRRYMISNRERPGMTQHFEFRSIFDVDGNRPLCVHDWEVPPAEEMLALKFCVELPGREYLIRRLAAQAH